VTEYNFDGIVGPTHNYAGLSPGNLASATHGGQRSNPREAALQGLEKMRFVASLGVGQAVLPPQPRPNLAALRAIGFSGSDAEVLAAAARDDGLWLRQCSSASAMWAANAATVVPSADAADGKLHLVPANLSFMFHRSLEAETTRRILAAIFAGERFVVHAPLLATLADEGAANHTRLLTAHKTVHLFAWGRRLTGPARAPARFPARHTREASEAVARLAGVSPLLVQQRPAGIDAGAFHTDVLAVGHGAFLMLHALAFVEDVPALLRARLGEDFRFVLASDAELPVAEAVKAYPFNSQLVTLPDGTMAIIAPEDAREAPHARAFLERVVSEDNPVRVVHYRDVRQSMHNGGGPACLRQRLVLTPAERAAIPANVFWNDTLGEALVAWVERHYRDRLEARDLADPALGREQEQALDALTQLLRLGSVYDFQK
jgi:succinylarginine dihydrolase